VRADQIAGVVGHGDHGHLLALLSKPLHELGDAHVAKLHGGDDQVERTLASRQIERFRTGAGVPHPRASCGSKLRKPPRTPSAGWPSSVRMNGVVQRRDQQDVVDAVPRQVREAVQAAARTKPAIRNRSRHARYYNSRVQI
jgi:hypothetical protein